MLSITAPFKWPFLGDTTVDGAGINSSRLWVTACMKSAVFLDHQIKVSLCQTSFGLMECLRTHDPHRHCGLSGVIITAQWRLLLAKAFYTSGRLKFCSHSLMKQIMWFHYNNAYHQSAVGVCDLTNGVSKRHSCLWCAGIACDHI